MKLVPAVVVLCLGGVPLSCAQQEAAGAGGPSGSPQAEKAEAAKVRQELEACRAELKVAREDKTTTAAPEPEPTNNLCSLIQLSPTEAALFKIQSFTESGLGCVLVLEMLKPIDRYSFDWVQYDKDSVKLDSGIEIIKNAAAGDKIRAEVRVETGAAKIVSMPRR